MLTPEDPIMMDKALFRIAAAFAALALTLAPACAQDFKPQVGQYGKDVIWVPSPDDVVERMLTMAQTTPNDYVIDLGSGDGRIAIMAAKKFGARAMGVEYNPDMVRLSQKNAQAAGVAGKASFKQADIFTTDFSQATVVTMYLLPSLNLKLRPLILAMKPGTRIVSHSFSMDDWTADEVSNVDGKRAYFWIVPANVQGTWSLEMTAEGRTERAELSLEQHYQQISGAVMRGPIAEGLREPRLRGFRIAFGHVDAAGVQREFNGRVTGDKMEGSFRTFGGTEGRWTAARR
jgi:SAM-dependent methyltransferase